MYYVQQTILNELQNASSFSELCRLCGKMKSPAISIFDESYRISYHEMINFHFKDIQVSKTDVLPLKLCSDCAQFVVSWHHFHNTCLQVNQALSCVVDKLHAKFIESESDPFDNKNDIEVIEVDVESVESIISPHKLPESSDQKLTVDENYRAEDAAEFSIKYVNNIVSDTLTTKTTTSFVESNSQNLSSNQYKLEADEFLVDVAELSDSSKCTPEGMTKSRDEVVVVSFPEIQDFSLLKGFILNDGTSKHHCSTCFKAHVTEEDLVDHICDKHESYISRNEMYECDMCAELFIKNTLRNSHRFIAHNIIIPLSEEFKIVRTNNQTTPSIIKINEDENPFSCEYCDLNFNRKGNLKLHKMRKHGVIYQNIRRCNICSMIFLNKKALRLHVKSVHARLLDESANTKITISEEYLQFLSKRIVYVNDIRYFQCENCQYKCRGLHRFIRHGNLHLNINFICAYCDKSFSRKGLLQRHICTVHLGIKKFDCSVCGKLFGEKKQMQEHMSLHQDVCTYICEVCGKQFKQRQSLDVHKQVHRGFTCEYCDKTFNFQNRLNNHMKKHTGKNLSVCQLCGKKFTSSTNLKEHMLSHSDVKAFQCSVCSRRLKTNRSLKQHMVLCHGNIKHEPCTKEVAMIEKM